MIRTNQSRSTHAPVITNEEIAQTLVEISDLLERQGANPYHIRAYRQGLKPSPTARRRSRRFSPSEASAA